jgi:SAM-dependent methyltransferase
MRKHSPETIARDFDALATLPEERWGHNVHYHDWLLRHLPPRIGRALEIGCGTGRFTRRLAERAGQVVAIDLSPAMIRVAHDRSRQHRNVRYQLADASTWPFPHEEFDCVASIATLHHLSLEPALMSMRDALRPGGTLLVLDLYEPTRSTDRLRDAVALPASALLRLAHTGRLLEPWQSRELWRRHGENDVYPRYDRIERACAHGLPGARVRRHLFWRYSIVWTKPRALSVDIAD